MAVSREGCIISMDSFNVIKEAYRFMDHTKNDKELYDAFSMILSKPPVVSVLRVNTLKFNNEVARRKLEARFESEGMQCKVVEHPEVGDVVVIAMHNDYTFDGNEVAMVPHSKEVIVDEICGAAVLRGADIFACGVLGALPGMTKGDCVSIHADLDGKCRKGSKVKFEGKKYFVGNGVAVLSRSEIFQEKQPRAVAIKVVNKLFNHPSFHKLDREVFFAQNLPSTLVSHNLGPRPGDIVLDMCAAPGGKATHAAILMKNKGQIFAIDKSKAKVNKMKDACEQQGLSCIQCFVFDSTQLCCEGGGPSLNEKPPYQPNSFDKIILDPPCSGIGQRPQLRCKVTANELKSYYTYQRKLFSEAVKLLKPNGKLIYSTCTITVEENENQVAWALKTFKELTLISQDLHLGGMGISGHELHKDQCSLVQRFDPCLLSISSAVGDGLSIDQDTIGFFTALFVKT